MSEVKPRPSLENNGKWVSIGTNEQILQVVPYRPERPPKWMFWKTQREYLAVVTKSNKFYIVDLSKDWAEVTQSKQL
jgi:hypothetical protein